MSIRLLSAFFGLIMTFLSLTASAQDGRGFGLGLLLGSPTAISGKYWMGRNAIDAGLAYDFDDSITIFGDYLWHFPGAFGARERFIRELSPYVGVGGLFHNSNDPWVYDKDRRRFWRDDDRETNLAVRVPVGIEWLPSNIPLGVFIELVPAIFIAPRTDAEFMGGIGIRYYFQ